MAGDWKFEDSPEVGVYKTRQVMAGEEPLGIVSHDLDGDWQFLHYEEVEDGDLRDAAHLMLVHLHHHTDRFPEAQDLADLPLGWVAWRESEDDPWV